MVQSAGGRSWKLPFGKGVLPELVGALSFLIGS
jgi:hypothetical protein